MLSMFAFTTHSILCSVVVCSRLLEAMCSAVQHKIITGISCSLKDRCVQILPKTGVV